MTRVRVGGETFEIDIRGLRDGDSVRCVGEQCEGCGHALDAGGEEIDGEPLGAYALLHGRRTEIRCSECGMVYPIVRDQR